MASHISTTQQQSGKRQQAPWYKDSLVYQIYPASFYCAPNSACPPNSKTSTVGNVKGIISKVSYIASLGFDAIWLSPIFASPQTDMGYDISDYRSIHPPYGTVEDVQELIDTLHATRIDDPTVVADPTSSSSLEGQSEGKEKGTRPMRLLMDLVVNHTSSSHPWFIESSESRTNSKSDWYFWRDPRIDSNTGTRSEPNNWRSIFGGPAWHYVESRQQYYLALFLPTQPDLNWENEAMRAEIYSDMKFWLDRGVDGWRIDSMNLMSKNPALPDAKITQPGEKYQDGKEFYASGPRMHEYLQEIRRKVFDEYGEDKIFTVGELGSSETVDSVSKYVASSRHELHCVFAGMDLDFGPNGKYDGSDPFKVSKLKEVTDKWQLAMPKFEGWNSIYLDNHDSGRSLSRYASDLPEFRAPAAKMLATYLCTLSGTVFVLAGQEIGTANLGPSVGIEGYIDVEGLNWYNKILSERRSQSHSKGDPDMSDVMQQLQLKARDHGRLPMQWTSESPNAGFCDPEFKPWMTVNPDFVQGWNVESQIDDPNSILAYWRKMVRFRRANSNIFVHGGYVPLSVDETGENVIGYERMDRDDQTKKMVVFLSFARKTVTVSTRKYDGWTKIFGNNNDTEDREKGRSEGKIQLQAYEALILSNY